MIIFSKLSMMVVLPFMVASAVFADLSEVTFDSSNCIELSAGSMKKVSIPLPTGWKDASKNQKMANKAQDRTLKIKTYSEEEILANYYNPKKNTEFVEIIQHEQNKGLSVPYDEFKEYIDKIKRDIEDGSLKSRTLENNADSDKSGGRRFQIFPPHEKDDHSFQFSVVSLSLNDAQIVFLVSSTAVVWIHERMFIITVWTTASNKNKTMDKMTDTRFCLSHWVEAILQENGCEANDMPDATDTTAEATEETKTIVTTDTEPSNDEKNARQNIDESIASDDADDETEPSKPSVVSFLGNLKSKALSITKREKQEDDTSLENDGKPSKFRKTFLETFAAMLTGSLIMSIIRRKRQGR